MTTETVTQFHLTTLMLSPMSTRVLSCSPNKSSNELMDQFITNCSNSLSSASDASSSGSALFRLVTYDDCDGTDASTYVITEEGAMSGPVPLTRISFDLTGLSVVTDDMLRELYDVFDVRQRGGVERTVMREMMKSGFSNYGAPCSERDVDRLFERVTPFHLRRQRGSAADNDIMSFHEFCALFLSWLRL